jgi:hypothetical protein
MSVDSYNDCIRPSSTLSCKNAPQLSMSYATATREPSKSRLVMTSSYSLRRSPIPLRASGGVVGSTREIAYHIAS